MKWSTWLVGMLAVAVVAGVLVGREARWMGALYCIGQRGQLWEASVGAVPPGFAARCPDTASYRAEVRRGESKVEQYSVSGWAPRTLLAPLKAAGWQQVTDDPINPVTYSAFLQKNGVRLQYLADRTTTGTLITLSGRP